MPGRKSQRVVSQQEFQRVFFRDGYAAGIVPLAAPVDFYKTFTVAATDAAPNTSAPDASRLIPGTDYGITVVAITPYWTGLTATTTVDVWEKQTDEPTATMQWRLTARLTFDPASPFEQRIHPAARDVFLQVTAGADGTHPIELHCDVA